MVDAREDRLSGFGLASVSCATATFCLAVDRGGFAVSYNGRSWVGLRYVDVETGAEGLDTVSCPRAGFCVAVDAGGNALVYNGTSWSQPVSIDFERLLRELDLLYDVEVLRRSGRGGSALTLTSGSWSAPYPAGRGVGILVSVSCPRASFCAAVDESGDELTYDGNSWSKPVRIDSGGFRRGPCPAPG